MKRKNVLLTYRDLYLFRWINSHRYVQARHIFAKLGVSDKYYRRLQQLTQAGYLVHEMIFRDLPGHYRVTKKAVDVAQDILSAPREVILSTYHHDMMIVSLALELERRTGGRWVTERILRFQVQQGQQGQDQKYENLRSYDVHLPDGLLLLAQSNRTVRIAVELEHLNRKTRKRLEKIITSYADGSSAVARVDRVMYFCCSPGIQNKIVGVVKNVGAEGLVQVRLLKEILPEERSGEYGGAEA
ncbi:MAG: hypothetical protein QHH75_13815 [Bacillota bacterium]|nr:hypothetical protein [Bacillota bacterium]